MRRFPRIVGALLAAYLGAGLRAQGPAAADVHVQLGDRVTIDKERSVVGLESH